MNDQSRMSFQPILPGTDNAISLQESESGPSLSEAPASLTIIPSGQEAALANLSARQAKALGLMTSGTSGQPSTISSESSALQTSLESRLRAKMVSPGWSLYKLTWKQRVTPSGRPICALRASPIPKSPGPWAAHIFDSAFIGVVDGWKTPNCPRTNDSDNTAGKVYASKKQMDLPEQAWLSGPETEVTPGCFAGKVLAGWPTPMAGTPAQNGNNEAGNTDSSRRTVALCGWPTPCQQDGPKGGPNQGTDRLPGAVQLAGWPTPTAKLAAGGEYKDKDKALARVLGPHSNDLRDFAQIAEPSTGSPAGTGNSGRLNPDFSLWLMRIPAVWVSCVPVATRSTRRRRKPS